MYTSSHIFFYLPPVIDIHSSCFLNFEAPDLAIPSYYMLLYLYLPMTVYVMKLDFYMCTEVPDMLDSCLSLKVSMLDMQKKKNGIYSCQAHQRRRRRHKSLRYHLYFHYQVSRLYLPLFSIPCK